MPSLTSILLGPELYWALVCGLVYVLCLRNLPPTDAGSGALETWWYIAPLLLFPLSYGLYALPTGAGPWWLLLRINLAAAVGIVVVAGLVASYVDFPSNPTRNSGVMAGFMIAVVFGLFAAVPLNLGTAGLLLWLGRRGG